MIDTSNLKDGDSVVVKLDRNDVDKLRGYSPYAYITPENIVEIIPAPVKRKFSGWVNVYWGSVIEFSDLFDTKERADKYGDNRIACIQIPEFTEGDGLE